MNLADRVVVVGSGSGRARQKIRTGEPAVAAAPAGSHCSGILSARSLPDWQSGKMRPAQSETCVGEFQKLAQKCPATDKHTRTRFAESNAQANGNAHTHIFVLGKTSEHFYQENYSNRR